MEHNQLQPPRRRGRPRKSDKAPNPYPEDLLSYYQNAPFTERERLIRTGITKNQLVRLKTLMNIDYDMVAALLAVTNRCLHLKKGNDVFSPITTDRIAAILDMYCEGLEIFKSSEDLNEWLATPMAILNNRSPLDVAKTHPGLLKVRELLFRIRIGQI